MFREVFVVGFLCLLSCSAVFAVGYTAGQLSVEAPTIDDLARLRVERDLVQARLERCKGSEKTDAVELTDAAK